MVLEAAESWLFALVQELLSAAVRGLTTGWSVRCPAAPPCPEVHLSCPAACPVLDVAGRLEVSVALSAAAAAFVGGLLLGAFLGRLSQSEARRLGEDARAQVALLRRGHGPAGW